MTRGEVETLLGHPASSMLDVGAAIQNYFDTPILYVVPQKTPMMGEFTSDGSRELAWKNLGSIIDGYVWEGREGRICLFFDDQGRVMAGWFLQRLTWRFKVQQWWPLLR